MRASRRARRRLPLRHALTLGLVQGPAELLPVSSSGHVVLLPALLGWPYGRLDPADRKAFEVALHLGTAGGLAVALRKEVVAVAKTLDARRLGTLAMEVAPGTCAGLLLHRAFAEPLSAPRRVARAQVAAGLALALADMRPVDRRRDDASPADAFAVGLAQAAALAPGVSRGGAALTALRLRRLDRRSASVASRHAAAPLVLGAGALEITRLRRRRLARPLAKSFAVGAAAAFGSTIAAARLAAAMDEARSYAPIAAYRVALGALALRRLPCAERRPWRVRSGWAPWHQSLG